MSKIKKITLLGLLFGAFFFTAQIFGSQVIERKIFLANLVLEEAELQKVIPAKIELNTQQWNAFIGKLREKIESPPVKPQLLWTAEQGWHLQKEKAGVALKNESNILAVQKNLRQQLAQIQELVAEPITLHVGEELFQLDLDSAEDFIVLKDNAATINREKIKKWVDAFAESLHVAPSTVTIVGAEEMSKGVNKAIIEGEFREGSRVGKNEVYEAILKAFETGERSVSVRRYESPVKVYSALENTEYELLGVGYSEYSQGNQKNRVHNIKTGLNRLNTMLVGPGETVSFNKLVGPLNDEFVMGWGIFGRVAEPILAGGLCQVSTTFYRGLLNLGIPITMRQNHSWDLSYYRNGGYGLDATVFPEKGLDVKGTNNFESSLFIYSYIRPETQEAFVLFYGKGDGRTVKLESYEDYQYFYGSKTIKWRQVIEWPDGRNEEHEIVSRYRI